MKKRHLLLAIAAMLLPMSMMAQTYHWHEVDGLRYIYQEGDDTNDPTKLFIIVNGSLTVDGTNVSNTYFVPDGGLRAAWRYKGDNEATCIKKVDGTTPLGSDRWYKNDMDAITEFLGTWGNNGPENYQGIEYFRNITSLTVKQNQTSGTYKQLALDLSKNTALQTLTFNTPSSARIKSLNISNCTNLTSLSLPSGSNGYLKTLIAENSGLTSLDISSCTALTTVNLANSADLATLTVKTSGTNSTLSSLNLKGCVKLSETYTSENPLDLSAYTNLNRFNVKVAGSGLVIGESIIFAPEDFTIEDKTIYADGEEVDSNYLKKFTMLQHLTCYDAAKLDVSKNTQLKYLEVKGTYDTDLVLSKDNTKLIILDVSYSGMTKLDLRGEGSSNYPNRSLAPNLKLVACCFAPIKKLDLAFHTKLEYLAVKSECGVGNDIKGSTKLEYKVWDTELKDSVKVDSYDMNAFIEICKRKTATNLVPYKHNSGNEDGYGINSVSHIRPEKRGKIEDLYFDTQLEEIDVTKCKMLKHLKVTGLENKNKKYEYTQIQKIYAGECDSLRDIVCINGRLKTLNTRGSDSLEYIAIEQNYLTDKSFDFRGCMNIKKFIAHRNRFTNLDFLTVPVGSRDSAAIAKLEQIQVNGGSYVIRKYNGEGVADTYISHLLDGDGDETVATGLANTGKRNHKFTSTLKRLNTHYLGTNMRILYCGDNLLEELDISTMPKLRQLECRNNMLLTLDLSKFRDPEDATPDPGKTDAKYVTDASWRDQVGFLDVEIVKGKTTSEDGISGKNDLVALHMPNGGYRHNLDNKLTLYRNLADEQAETGEVASEANAHMCYIQNHEALCPTDHTGLHLFLHDGQEIITDFGKVKDQDLYGGVLNYKYDTQVLCDSATYSRATPPNEEQCKSSGAGTWEWEDASHGGSSGYPVLRGRNYAFHDSSLGTVDKHINVRVHIWPYIMYVNPATKSGSYKVKNEAGEEEKKDIDYYSGTIYLDYAAIIPEGLEAYVAIGIVGNDTTTITANGTAQAFQQLKMVKVGEAGEIVPAETPLYVKPVLPSAAKRAGGWSQPAAGLYDFQTAWDFKLNGWEDYRGCSPDGEEFPPKLHGPDVDNYSAESIVWREGCDPITNSDRWIDNKKFVVDEVEYSWQEIKDANLLKGTLEQINLDDNSLGLQRRSVLVLGLESQKKTKMIGFWPQNAKYIDAHRCYITHDDAMEKLGGAPGVSVPATSVAGFKFSFANEDSFLEDVGDANGDGVVSIADVTAIINKINGVVTGKFVEKAADVNKDGIISIADVTGVINTINNQ